MRSIIRAANLVINLFTNLFTNLLTNLPTNLFILARKIRWCRLYFEKQQSREKTHRRMGNMIICTGRTAIKE